MRSLDGPGKNSRWPSEPAKGTAAPVFCNFCSQSCIYYFGYKILVTLVVTDGYSVTIFKIQRLQQCIFICSSLNGMVINILYHCFLDTDKDFIKID